MHADEEIRKPTLYAIHDKHDQLVEAIVPQFCLDDLYRVAAEWACQQFIPTSLAQQAVVKTMFAEGYKVVHYALTRQLA